MMEALHLYHCLFWTVPFLSFLWLLQFLQSTMGLLQIKVKFVLFQKHI